jgi:hypothetical protein
MGVGSGHYKSRWIIKIAKSANLPERIHVQAIVVGNYWENLGMIE